MFVSADGEAGGEGPPRASDGAAEQRGEAGQQETEGRLPRLKPDVCIFLIKHLLYSLFGLQCKGVVITDV